MNQNLRSHVTSGAFVLTLSKTHIAAMVWIDQTYAAGVSAIHHGRSPWSHFIGGMRGLRDRGLAWHVYDVEGSDASTRDRPANELYGLTPAGEAVKALLVEAGIWQEYLESMPTHVHV